MPGATAPNDVSAWRKRYQRVDHHTGQPIAGKFEFVYRDSTRRQRWQTANGDTKADAKAERVEILARLHRGERIERSSRTVAEVAEAWLERSRGQNGPWDTATAERYRRVVQLQLPACADPTRRLLGELKLRDLRRTGWRNGKQQRAGPGAHNGLAGLDRLEPNLSVDIRRGWIGVNPVMQLEPGEKPRWEVTPSRILEGADLGTYWRMPNRGVLCSSAWLSRGCGSEALGCAGATWTSMRRASGGATTLQGSKTEDSEDALFAVKSCSPPASRGSCGSVVGLPVQGGQGVGVLRGDGHGDDCRLAGRRSRPRSRRRVCTARPTIPPLDAPRFASLLIANRLNVVFVSRQLGHASPQRRWRCTRPVPAGGQCGGGEEGAPGELRGDDGGVGPASTVPW